MEERVQAQIQIELALVQMILQDLVQLVALQELLTEQKHRVLIVKCMLLLQEILIKAL